MTPLLRFALIAAVLLAGAVLMSLEILAFRIVGRTFGSALRETSMVISVFLTAMSAGYWAGGRWADRNPSPTTLATVLALAGASVALVPYLSEGLAAAVFRSSLPLAFHAATVSILLFFIPTMLLASVSPIVIRIRTSEIANSGSVAGSTSAVSTAGSIAGSLGTAFILIDLLESVDLTLIMLSIVPLLLSLAIVGATGGRLPRRHKQTWSLGLAALMTIILLGAAKRAPTTPTGGEAASYGHKVVFERDSTYHHIFVRDFNRVRHLYFDRTLQTTMSLSDVNQGGSPYTQAFHLVYALGPVKDVLFIGVGGGSGPKEFVHDHAATTAVGVDVDPLVLRVAQDLFGVKTSDRLQLAAGDGRAWMKRSQRTFDAIVVDAYTTNRYGATIPQHLATREFFELAKSRLRPGGVLVFNCARPAAHILTRAISKTLYSSFAEQFVVTVGTNSVLFASDIPLPRDAEAMKGAVTATRHRGVAVRATVDPLLAGTGRISDDQYLGVPVLTDDFAPVDTLMRR